jgi:hypothetical protein
MRAVPECDSSHRTRSNVPPIPPGLCGVGGCVFLAGHPGATHSWQTLGVVDDGL